MADLSVLISSLPPLPGISSSKTEEVNAADNFLSLLNIGNDDDADSASSYNEERKEKKPQDPQGLAAAAVVPLPFEQDRPARGDETRQAPREILAKEEPAERAEPQQKSVGRRLIPKAPEEHADAKVTAPEAKLPARTDSAGENTKPSEAPNTKRTDTKEVKDTLKAIGQVLTAILEAVSTKSSTQQTVEITNAIASGQPLLADAIAAALEQTGSVDASLLTATDAQEVALAAASGFGAPSDTDEVPLPLEIAAIMGDSPESARIDGVLKKLEGLLQQFQTLGAAEHADEHALVAAQNQLAPLTAKLQKSLDVLNQFLQVSETPLTETTEIKVTSSEAKTLLEEAIATLKTYGQAAKAPEEDTKTEIAKPAPAQPVLETVEVAEISDKHVALNLAGKAAKAGAEQGAAVNAASSNVQPVSVNPASVTTQPMSAPVATTQVAPAQESAKNSSGDSGSNQQQQTPPAPVTPTALSASGQSEAAYKNSFQQALDKVSPAALREQVAFEVKTALSDGSSRINIKLDPAELGKLEIKIHVGSDGKTGVMITADNKGTLDLLQRDAQGLMRALSDAGLQTESGSLSFNLRGGQQDNSEQGRSQLAQVYQKAQPEEEAVDVISRSYVVNLAQGLDIKI